MIGYYPIIKTMKDRSIPKNLSPNARAATKALFDYQKKLRHYLVWEHDDPEPTVGYPRFIAVIEDEKEFKRYKAQREPILKDLKKYERPTRWLPTFLNETWSHASLSINTAYSSRRIKKSPYELRLPGVKKRQWEAKERVLKVRLPKLKALPGVRDVRLEVEEDEDDPSLLIPKLVITCKPNTLTVRRYSGRAFRLRGHTTTGKERPHRKLGIMVLRGLELKNVKDTKDIRKKRADAKTLRVLIDEGYELVSD
jgi:hypothetical protein